VQTPSSFRKPEVAGLIQIWGMFRIGDHTLGTWTLRRNPVTCGSADGVYCEQRKLHHLTTDEGMSPSMGQQPLAYSTACYIAAAIHTAFSSTGGERDKEKVDEIVLRIPLFVE